MTSLSKLLAKVNAKRKLFVILSKESKVFNVIIKIIILYRDANFYGLLVVTTENCKNFQFSMDYGKLGIFLREFKKKKEIVIRNVVKKALNKKI